MHRFGLFRIFPRLTDTHVPSRPRIIACRAEDRRPFRFCVDNDEYHYHEGLQ